MQYSLKNAGNRGPQDFCNRDFHVVVLLQTGFQRAAPLGVLLLGQSMWRRQISVPDATCRVCSLKIEHNLTSSFWSVLMVYVQPADFTYTELFLLRRPCIQFSSALLLQYFLHTFKRKILSCLKNKSWGAIHLCLGKIMSQILRCEMGRWYAHGLRHLLLVANCWA